MYSRTQLDNFPPYKFMLIDAYGESISLSESKVAGDVLQLEVSEYNDDGEPLVINVSGNFHQDDRQNHIEFLVRLRGMKELSEQENQVLTMIVPAPQIQMRGRISNLSGPTWQSYPYPGIYDYKFEFRREETPRQPRLFSCLADAILGEGKDYVTLAIPSADYTNVRDLAYAWYGKEYCDGQKIREILSLNGLSISDARHLSVGQVLKLPVKTY